VDITKASILTSKKFKGEKNDLDDLSWEARYTNELCLAT
jgi:hypothetical protein